MISFKEKVLFVVKNIPKGSVLTYGQVAELAGSPRAHRAVGTILSKNFNPEIPCHRVIKADGKFGNYNGGEEKKRQLLNKEGVKEV